MAQISSKHQQPQSSQDTPQARQQNQQERPLKSPSEMSPLFGEVKAKLGGKGKKHQALPSDEAEFEKLREKEQKKEERKHEYDRLELGNRTKFGMGRGGMQMGGM
ncbi:hypothetical protein EJ05DRAFT_479694 [Pseudovirgaria hyperparasitica]|uniref:Uncharacterized protein n=1 Tax=Pseudovirgaria hyperparasitica TaxID=470096 RepID=A0A6A6VVF3_9PEZI|nr:uncharacterized protein EJ05DRAFT_479694 [Pseudovirgaria hyperparasitica]KAF2754145.1 hypothetical protein EJ05DRAFT_479694 [Pseudovirgaria hyperparasitica]